MMRWRSIIENRQCSMTQLGDPAKGGAIIVDTALRQDAPLRLILGSDALQAVQMTLQGRLDELQNMARK